MKVVLVNKYWYQRGGTERVLFFTKQLLEAAGHHVYMFGMHHPANEWSNKYFVDYEDYHQPHLSQKIRAARQAVYHKEARERFSQLLRDVKPDVVHFHNIYHQLSYSLLDAVAEHNIRAVMTLHDYKVISPNYTLFHHGKIDDGSLGKKYYRCLLNNCMESWPQSLVATIEAYTRSAEKLLDHVDLFFAPSQFMKDMCVQGGIAEGRIQLLHNPMPSMAKRYTKPKDGYLAFVGRLSKEKGVDTLLDAAALTPNIQYRIIGDGPEKSYLEEKARLLKLKNVHFDGWQTGKNLDALIRGAHAIVVPSRWYENCPYSMLEAMAGGKPVIGSNIGGIPELLDAWWLFEPNNALSLAQKAKACYDLPSTEYRAIGKRLQEKIATQYAPDAYLQSLLSYYHAT